MLIICHWFTMVTRNHVCLVVVCACDRVRRLHHKVAEMADLPNLSLAVIGYNVQFYDHAHSDM